MATRLDPVARACALHEEAGALRAAGKAAASLRVARKAVQLFEREDGPRSPDVANVLLDVAAAEADIGRYAAALASAERAWKIVRRLRSDGDDLARLKISTLGTLGHIRITRGEYALAAAAHERALPFAEALGGPELAGVLNSLGIVCKYTARFDEGHRHYIRALRILEKHQGKESLEVAAVLHNLGGLEHTRGRFARGIPWAERGYAIRLRALGKRHPDVAADAAALAALLDGAGRLAEAERLYAQALDVYERTFGPNHFEVGFNLGNLAALEHGRGNLAKAARLYERSLRIQRKALGARHPYVALTLHNLGVLRRAQGRVKEASEAFRSSVAAYIRALGADHPETKAARASLAALGGVANARSSRGVAS